MNLDAYYNSWLPEHTNYDFVTDIKGRLWTVYYSKADGSFVEATTELRSKSGRLVKTVVALNERRFYQRRFKDNGNN